MNMRTLTVMQGRKEKKKTQNPKGDALKTPRTLGAWPRWKGFKIEEGKTERSAALRPKSNPLGQ